jgi:glucose-1-phosphate thymidylyltransferase
MKALITAGGQGTRMQRLSKTLNKHLLTIIDRPLLFYVLENITTAGITEVGIAINPGDEEVMQAVGNGKQFGINVTYIEAGPSLEMPEIIMKSKDFVGEESFVFYLGDNLIEQGIQQFVNDFIKKGKPDCYLVLAKADHLERYGVAKIDHEHIHSFTEKPKAPQEGHHAITGISIYNPRVLRSIQQIEANRFKEMTISDMHQYLLENGFRFVYSIATGWWKDVGTPEDFLIVKKLLLKELSSSTRG